MLKNRYLDLLSSSRYLFLFERLLSIAVNEKVEVYNEIAARECEKMEEALRKIAFSFIYIHY